MRTFSTLTAIALALGLAAPIASVPAPALAQEEMGIDANENDIIDQDEWTSYSDTFDDWDADDSGYLDEDEWNAGAEANFGGMPGGGDDDGPVFGLFDTTDDNQVGEDEYFNEESFGELDDDQSGTLEDEEFGV